MHERLYVCGPALTESEGQAVAFLRGALRSQPLEPSWLFLAHLAVAVDQRLHCEIADLVAIGPPGIRLLEIKHWPPQWLEAQPTLAKQEMRALTKKARTLAARVRRTLQREVPLESAVLVTHDAWRPRNSPPSEIEGIRFFRLQDWQAALASGQTSLLSPEEITHIAHALAPPHARTVANDPGRLAGYVHLQRQSPAADRFRRIYRATHAVRRDRVLLYLYDFSASNERKPEAAAEADFLVYARLRSFPWAPRILDPSQPVPGYAGEMAFFSVIGPGRTVPRRTGYRSGLGSGAADRVRLRSRARFARVAGGYGRGPSRPLALHSAHHPRSARQPAAVHFARKPKRRGDRVQRNRATAG